MNVKKVTKKDRYGNSTTVEYEAPTKPLDPTALLKAQMEEQHSHAMHMMQAPPPVGGEEFVPGNPMTHPGQPKGEDTVPAWLTPGEFVVNAEAMSIPENAAMVEQINNQGRAMQNGGYLNAGGRADYQGAPMMEAVQAPPPKPYMGAMPMPRPAQQELRPQAPIDSTPIMPMMPDEYMIKKREGYNPEVYMDSQGHPTTGYGHKLPASYTDQVGNQPYSEAELNMFFDKDIATAQRAAKENIGLENFEQLSRQQQAALTSMAFQLGPAGQRKFKKMIAAIKRGDHTAAAYEALTGSEGGKSKWLRQTPKRALDLAAAFDPNVAAQYRQAGGTVYAEEGGWLKQLVSPAAEAIAAYAYPEREERTLTGAQIGEMISNYHQETNPQVKASMEKMIDEAIDTQGSHKPRFSWMPSTSYMMNYKNTGGSIYEDDMSTMTMDIPFDPNATFDAPAFDPGGGLDYSGEFDGISVSPISDTQSAITTSAGPKILRDPIPEPAPAPEPTGRGEHWLMGYGVDDYWKGMGPGGEFEQFLEHGFEDVAEPGHVNIDPDTPQGQIYQELLGQEIHDDLLSGERTIWDPEIAEGDSQELDALKSHNANLWLESAREDLENRPSSATLEEYKEAEAYATAVNAEYNENTKERNKAAEDRARKREEDQAEIAEILDDVPPEERTRKPKKPTTVDAHANLADLVTATPGPEDTGPGENQPGENAQAPGVEQAGQAVIEEEGGKEKEHEAITMLKDMFGDVFPSAALTKTALLYLGSRAMGYSHSGSLQWAATQHLTDYENRKAAEAAATAKRNEQAFELAKTGKFSGEQVEAFKRTGNLAYLSAGAGNFTQTGKTKQYMIGGKPTTTREVKDPQGNVRYVTSDGREVDITKAVEVDSSFIKGTPEYRERRSRATGDAAGRFKETLDTFDTYRTGSGQNVQVNHHTNIKPKQAADEFWAFAEKNGLDPESDEALSIMTNAYQAAINDAKANPDKVKPNRLTKYLEQEMIRETVGRPELFVTNADAVAEGKAQPVYVRADKMNALDESVNALISVSPVEGLSKKLVYSEMQAAWASANQKHYNKMAGPGESGFYVFVNEQLGKLYQQLQSQ